MTAAGGIGCGGDKTQSENDQNIDDGIASLDGLISKSSSVSSSPGSGKSGHHPDKEGDKMNEHLQQNKEQENVCMTDPSPVASHRGGADGRNQGYLRSIVNGCE